MSVTAMGAALSFPPRSVRLSSRPVIVSITFDNSISDDELRLCSFVNYWGYAVLVSPGIQMPKMLTAPEFRVEPQQQL